MAVRRKPTEAARLRAIDRAAERKAAREAEAAANRVRVARCSPLSADGARLWAKFQEAALAPLTLGEDHATVYTNPLGCPGLDELLDREWISYVDPGSYTLTAAGWSALAPERMSS